VGGVVGLGVGVVGLAVSGVALAVSESAFAAYQQERRDEQRRATAGWGMVSGTSAIVGGVLLVSGAAVSVASMMVE
jgi:hypothetical protein